MKRLAGNLLLALASALAAVVAVEAGLRIAGISHPNFYMRDVRTGAALRPGAAGWWRAEGESYVRISSAGLRDREHAKAKPPGTVRIAILGDSYAEALQLPMEDAFWAVMERELRTCGALEGKAVEAINFGVSGYGTAQELLALRHRGWDYDPDVVVLAFVTGNDVRNNLRELENDPDRPYFVFRDGAPAIDNGYLASGRYAPAQLAIRRLWSGLLDRSRILQVANRAKNVIQARRAAARQRGAAASVRALGRAEPGGPAARGAERPALGADRKAKATAIRAEAAAPGGEGGLDDMVYREPSDPLWREAWRVTEGLIALMDEEVRAKGARLLVVTLSSGIQVHPDPAVREAYRKSLGVPDLFYPDRRVKALCERKGIPVLTLTPLFREYAEARRIPLHGFDGNVGWGHWNREGHRLAGQAMAQALCRVVAQEGNPIRPGRSIPDAAAPAYGPRPSR